MEQFLIMNDELSVSAFEQVIYRPEAVLSSPFQISPGKSTSAQKSSEAPDHRLTIQRGP
jgi:hypothetical protein